MSFAKGTQVDASKSRAEIEKLLTKRKASQLGVSFDTENGKAIVVFTMPGAITTQANKWSTPPQPEVRDPKQTVAFSVSMPLRAEFDKSRNGYRPTQEKAQQLWEQAVRERWRCLLMVLKGKFTAIDSGVESFEEAFFPHLQIPSGGTVKEHVMPAYKNAIANPGAPLLESGR